MTNRLVVLATILAAWAAGFGCASAATAPAATAPALMAPAGAAVPAIPEGAKIILRRDFDRDAGGLAGGGRHSPEAVGGRSGVLLLPRTGPLEQSTSLDLDLTITDQTFIRFRYYADGPGNLGIRLIPARPASEPTTASGPGPVGGEKAGEKWRCASISPLVQRQWTEVVIPITATFPMGRYDHNPARPGERFTRLSLHVLYGEGGEKIIFGEAQRKNCLAIDDLTIYDVPPEARALALVRELSGLTDRANQLKAALPADLWASLVATLQKAGADANAAAKDPAPAKVEALARRVEQARDRVQRLQTWYEPTMRLTGQKRPALAVAVESPMARVTEQNPAYRLAARPGQPARIDLARGELESVQLVLLPLEADLKGVKLEWTPPKSKAGKELPAAALTARLPECVFMPATGNQHAWHWQYVGPTPDPLMPITGPFDVGLDQERAVMLTFDCPRAAAAGEYATTVTIAAAGAEPVRVPLTIRVRDFEVPLRGRLRNQTNFKLAELERFYGQPLTEAQRRAWQVFLLRHRIQPVAQYGKELTPPPEDIEYLFGHGLNMVMIGGWSGDRNPKLDVDKVRPQYEAIRKLGVLDLSVIYIADEVGPSHIPQINDKADTAHREFAGIRVMTGGVTLLDKLIGRLDVWDPICSRHESGMEEKNAAALPAARARGEETFWYICCGPRPPYANVQLCNPSGEGRIWYWLTWQYGLTGSEYWNFLDFKKNVRPAGEKRWPEAPWDSFAFNPGADGNLAYPGPDGMPIASLRLENMRDGAEDWECLSILADLRGLARAKLEPGAAAALTRGNRAADLSGLIRQVWDFERSDAAWLARRTEMLDAIEELMKAVGPENYRRAAAQADWQTLQLRRRALADKIKAAGGQGPDYSNSLLEKDIRGRMK